MHLVDQERQPDRFPDTPNVTTTKHHTASFSIGSGQTMEFLVEGGVSQTEVLNTQSCDIDAYKAYCAAPQEKSDHHNN